MPVSYKELGFVNTREMFRNAMKDGYAVPAYNFNNMEQLQAIVNACCRSRSPVILQLSKGARDYANSTLLRWMGRGAVEMMKELGKPVPVALHLDHGESLDQIEKAIAIGYTSVMIDGSKLPFAENIALTAEAAKIAHNAGVTLEAEIGHVPFGDGEIELSTAAEADEFVGKTGVDALAISIGTIHGFYKKAPVLDIARAAEIGGKVGVPLVLHGGTGVPDDQLKLAVGCGVAKVNIATELQSTFLKGAAAEIAANGDKFKPLDLYFKPAEQKVFDFVCAKIRSLQ